MSAFDPLALTRIADFARTLTRLHKTARQRAVDDDQIDRAFNAVCMSVWGYTTDDISDDLFSATDHTFLDGLDEARLSGVSRPRFSARIIQQKPHQSLSMPSSSMRS